MVRWRPYDQVRHYKLKALLIGISQSASSHMPRSRSAVLWAVSASEGKQSNSCAMITMVEDYNVLIQLADIEFGSPN